MAMSRLARHPNVVSLLGLIDYSNGQRRLSLVVEYCQHGALDELLYGARSRSFSAQQVTHIVAGAAMGVYFLHRNNVIHRDLAARNVLLDAQLTAKVGDFGMARVNSELNGNQTASTIGPVKWWAPESMLEQSYSFKSGISSILSEWGLLFVSNKLTAVLLL
jgi:serine/threonine protein kinase